MGRTYYAIKNTDTDDYWSVVGGGFVLELDPCDLYTDHGAMLEQAQRLTLHYGPCIIIEQYTLHFAGILTISAERDDHGTMRYYYNEQELISAVEKE